MILRLANYSIDLLIKFLEIFCHLQCDEAAGRVGKVGDRGSREE